MLQEVPYAMITAATYAAVSCIRCGYMPDSTKGEQIYGVAADDPIRYCSQKCLQADAAVHRLETRALQAFAALSVEGSTEAIRLIIRMAALKRQEVLGLRLTLGTPNFPNWGSNNLFGHVMSLEAPTGSIDAQALEDIAAVAQVLGELLEEAGTPLGDDEDANHLLLAIQSNAHRVVDADKRCVGLGTFPLTSMLNHSCSPNCAHHFLLRQGQPPALVMQAIEDISAGDELCYNYIPLYQSTERRRLQLSSAYSFTCDCPRCAQASSSPPSFSSSSLGSSSDERAPRSPALFPRDHVLSDVNVSSGDGSATASTSTEGARPPLDFDSVPRCDGKTLNAVSAEISMCNNLLATAANNPKACKSVSKKIVKFFGDRGKAGALHPCHELALNAYVTCAKVSAILLPGETSTLEPLQEEEALLFAQAVVGLGALALGCIVKFTRVRNNDVAELEALIARGVRWLEGGAAEGQGEGCTTSSFVQTALAALTALGHVWAEEAVVQELLAAACTHAVAAAAAAASSRSTGSPQSIYQAFVTASKISQISS